MNKIKRMVQLCSYHERDRILRYYERCRYDDNGDISDIWDTLTIDDILEFITYGLLEGYEHNLISDLLVRLGGYLSLPNCSTMIQSDVDTFYSTLDDCILNIIQ